MIIQIALGFALGFLLFALLLLIFRLTFWCQTRSKSEPLCAGLCDRILSHCLS